MNHTPFACRSRERARRAERNRAFGSVVPDALLATWHSLGSSATQVVFVRRLVKRTRGWTTRNFRTEASFGSRNLSLLWSYVCNHCLQGPDFRKRDDPLRQHRTASAALRRRQR